MRLWRQRRAEFGVAMAAFLGVALLGVLPGIALAVVLSILGVFRRAWAPYRTLLGDVPGVPGYHDIRMYPDAVQLPGLVIYRFDAPLIFANASTFRDEVRRLARTDPPPRWIVIASEPITDIDTTAADMLEELDGELDRLGIRLYFAEMKDAVQGQDPRTTASRGSRTATPSSRRSGRRRRPTGRRPGSRRRTGTARARGPPPRG